MRGDMQPILIRPPGLVIIINILGESADIHHAKMRVDIRPLIGSRLSPVIESCPDKTADPPGSAGSQRPPLLRRIGPPLSGEIPVRKIAKDAVFYVDTPGGDGTSHLRSHNRLTGMIAMIAVHASDPGVESPYPD